MKRIAMLFVSAALLLTMAACERKADGSKTTASIPTQVDNTPQQTEVTTTTTGVEEAEEVTCSTNELPSSSTLPPQVTTQTSHVHNYSAAVIEPSCTAEGYTEYICSCGDKHKGNYTATVGHSFTDDVIAPTDEAQGYTKHTCLRCGFSYNDTYTDALPARWDTEAAVADLCARANAYIESVGCIVDPNAESWCAPRYTGVNGVDEEICYRAVLNEIDTYWAEGKTHLYVYYLPYADAFRIYVAYNTIISG